MYTKSQDIFSIELFNISLLTQKQTIEKQRQSIILLHRTFKSCRCFPKLYPFKIISIKTISFWTKLQWPYILRLKSKPQTYILIYHINSSCIQQIMQIKLFHTRYSKFETHFKYLWLKSDPDKKSFYALTSYYVEQGYIFSYPKVRLLYL